MKIYKYQNRKKLIAGFLLLIISIVIYTDSKFHFSKTRVETKRMHYSAQRHWSLFFKPQFVYFDSSIRYEHDFNKIKTIVEPGFAVLSDRPTSYYSAAYLPVYIRNVHEHNGLNLIGGVRQFIYNGNLCYINDEYHRQKTYEFLKHDYQLAITKGIPQLKYLIVNKDKRNHQLKRDCIAVKSNNIITNIEEFGVLLYEGEFLNLYDINPADIYSM